MLFISRTSLHVVFKVGRKLVDYFDAPLVGVVCSVWRHPRVK